MPPGDDGGDQGQDGDDLGEAWAPEAAPATGGGVSACSALLRSCSATM
jgi:hypothetical protein